MSYFVDPSRSRPFFSPGASGHWSLVGVCQVEGGRKEEEEEEETEEEDSGVNAWFSSCTTLSTITRTEYRRDALHHHRGDELRCQLRPQTAHRCDRWTARAGCATDAMGCG